MLKDTLGGYASIDAFVAAKLKIYLGSSRDLGALFDAMFSESGNVMFERSAGYRIERMTYGECRGRVLRRAAVLKRRLAGAPEGSVIGLCLDNSSDWIEVFWAILASGFRPLLMNLRLPVDTLRGAVRDISAAAVISENGRDFGVQPLSLSELAPEGGEFAPAGFGRSVFVMSSGTSEHVKICEYTGEQFCSMIADSADIIRRCPAIKKHYKGSLKLLAFLPFYHIFGLVAVYLWFAFFSRTFVLLKDMSPTTIMDTIRRHEVTHIFAVPMFWNKVHQEAVKAIRERGEATNNRFQRGMRLAKKLAGVPLVGSAFRRLAFREVRSQLFGKSIRFMISGGSEISSEVLEFFNGIGYRLANGYGMTEIGITSVELSANFRLLTSGSVGLPFSSADYSVDDRGRLIVSGPCRAERIIEGGVSHEREPAFLTGDLAEFKNGRWYILGRADDLVISPTGENLNPCVIEDKLIVPGVREVCLTSVRENGLIVPTLIASLKPGISGKAARRASEDLRKAMAENGLEGQIAKVVLVREPLIGGDDFKLNRGKISRRYQSGGFTLFDPSAEGSAEGADPAIVKRVRELFASALGCDIEGVTPTTDFFLDAGGSSLEFFSVAAAVQDEYGVVFPAGSGQTLSRPCDIADFITASAGSI